MNLEQTITEIGKKSKSASTRLMSLPTIVKNSVLEKIAELLIEKKEFIQKENLKDLTSGKEKGLSDAMLDRLALTDTVIDSMVTGLREVIALPDPVGVMTDSVKRPNGLDIARMRVPLGVIAMIYESRPNVTVDAAALCLKAGNCTILRGGSEAINSNLALASILQEALKSEGADPNAIQVVPVADRDAVTFMLGLEDYIDLVIPRGGEGLIRFVSKTSRIPVLKHYKGVCHVYIDKDADLTKVNAIIENSKAQRPGVCNALEGVLVHKDVADACLPALAEHMHSFGVEMKGCNKSTSLSKFISSATDDDWGEEFLRLCMCVKVVDSIEEAQNYIQTHGSLHTEGIITQNYTTARKFVAEVDASAVVVNASTRFNDGSQLGLGTEIGISTSKLHAYGPMGLEELTTRKFVVYGEGQVRN